MIVGIVDANGLPRVELEVAGRIWSALVDTGCNTDLELPYSLGPSVNARYICRMRSLLAGGQSIEEDNYAVEFPFDGAVVDAEATFTPGDEILIGTRLLRNHRLEINFVTRSVLIERVG